MADRRSSGVLLKLREIADFLQLNRTGSIPVTISKTEATDRKRRQTDEDCWGYKA